jgi:hypothetical protein
LRLQIKQYAKELTEIGDPDIRVVDGATLAREVV